MVISLAATVILASLAVAQLRRHGGLAQLTVRWLDEQASQDSNFNQMLSTT